MSFSRTYSANCMAVSDAGASGMMSSIHLHCSYGVKYIIHHLPISKRRQVHAFSYIIFMRFHKLFFVQYAQTRHRASTSVYSLTFRVRFTTPRSMDEMERRTQQTSRFYCRRGESSPVCVVCVCVCVCIMRAACGGPGGLPLGSATHFHSVAIATQPVHRLQTRPIVHN